MKWKQETRGKIEHEISEIYMLVVEIKRLHDSNNMNHIYEYQSRNDNLRKYPPKVKVTFPNFKPQQITREQLLEQFGSVSPLKIKQEVQTYSNQSKGLGNGLNEHECLTPQ